MVDEITPGHGPDRPAVYRVRVRGQIGAHWAGWFEGFEIATDAAGDTALVGEVIDQAALHGLLKRVRDAGLTLISVATLAAGEDTVISDADSPESAEGM